jgi:hypothetical protein
MEQTAVEWLQELYNSRPDWEQFILIEEFEQARAMEREQIINAVNSQRQLGWDEKGQQYYKETYGNEQGSK